MVAHAIRTKTSERGPRAFEPARDLNGVARLLEEAFRSEHTFPLSKTPVLREVGIALWTLSYVPIFPENVTGFVWLEDGRIVGNVTISHDEGRTNRYLLSNVAVKPGFRRQGIARALLQITLDHLRERGAKWVLLNVRPNNAGAIKLYVDLGFQQVEMRGEWAISSNPPSAARPGGSAVPVNRDSAAGVVKIRPLRFSDHHRVSELLRAAVPPAVQQFRQSSVGEFDPSWEDQLAEMITDFFIGQVTHRWVLERNGGLAALVTLRAQRLVSPHRFAIQVHSDWRGLVENDLVEFALQDLVRFPRRETRAAATSANPELVAALEQHGFALLDGLALMSLEL